MVGYENDYDDRLLGDGKAPEQDEKKEKELEFKEEYYELPPAIRRRTLIWSIASVVLASLSVLLSSFYYVGIVLSFLAIGSSLISRRNLGFFDRFSVVGIIVAVMGFVFNGFSLIIGVFGIELFK